MLCTTPHHRLLSRLLLFYIVPCSPTHQAESVSAKGLTCSPCLVFISPHSHKPVSQSRCLLHSLAPRLGLPAFSTALFTLSGPSNPFQFTIASSTPLTSKLRHLPSSVPPGAFGTKLFKKGRKGREGEQEYECPWVSDFLFLCLKELLHCLLAFIIAMKSHL